MQISASNHLVTEIGVETAENGLRRVWPAVWEIKAVAKIDFLPSAPAGDPWPRDKDHRAQENTNTSLEIFLSDVYFNMSVVQTDDTIFPVAKAWHRVWTEGEETGFD